MVPSSCSSAIALRSRAGPRQSRLSRARRGWRRTCRRESPAPAPRPPRQAPRRHPAVRPSAPSVAFALRYFDGMELTDVAQACCVSLATIKRRIARAEEGFRNGALGVPALATYLEGGGSRWTGG
jgi:hypothetical protein